MAAIDAGQKLTVRVSVTGMRLSPTHRRTVEAIRVNRFDIDRGSIDAAKDRIQCGDG